MSKNGGKTSPERIACLETDLKYLRTEVDRGFNEVDEKLEALMNNHIHTLGEQISELRKLVIGALISVLVSIGATTLSFLLQK